MHVLVILGSSSMIHHYRIIVYIIYISYLDPKEENLVAVKDGKKRKRPAHSVFHRTPPTPQPLVHQSTENRSSTIK